MLIAAVLVGIVALATLLGLAWRATTGRVRRAQGEAHDFADGVTLLQFSTDVCAPCVSTHALLSSIAAERNVSHVDVDVTHRPDIANRFNLLQSPTTLILDADGNIRARIGGAPRPADVRAALDRIAAHSTAAQSTAAQSTAAPSVPAPSIAA